MCHFHVICASVNDNKDGVRKGACFKRILIADAKSSYFEAVLDDWIVCVIKSRISKFAAKQGQKNVEKNDEKSQKGAFLAAFRVTAQRASVSLLDFSD